MTSRWKASRRPTRHARRVRFGRLEIDQGLVQPDLEDPRDDVLATLVSDLTPRIKAGELVKRLSPIVGGGGGGRPDFAQAGGKLPENLPEALAAVEDAVREQLGLAPLPSIR